MASRSNTASTKGDMFGLKYLVRRLSQPTDTYLNKRRRHHKKPQLTKLIHQNKQHKTFVVKLGLLKALNEIVTFVDC